MLPLVGGEIKHHERQDEKPMSDELAFVEEIRAHPEDDDRRLVYADYLEDEGDARGELIRTQIELQHLPVAAPQRVSLMRREDELLAAYGDQWLEPLRRLGAQGLSIRCFQRGLIERVRTSAHDFVKNAQALCAAAPALHCVELREPASAAAQLNKMVWPTQLTGLDLGAANVSEELVETLSNALWTPQLCELNLQFNQLGDRGASALATWNCPALRVLKLGMNNIGATGLTALCRWQPLWNVESLALNLNPLGDAASQLGMPVQRLESSVLVENPGHAWRSLDLASVRLSSNGLGLLLQHGQLQTVRHLNLRANSIDRAGWQALAESLGSQLQWLDTRNNQARLDDDIATRFINCEVLR